MKKREHTFGEPGEQWHWKITVTVLSAIAAKLKAMEPELRSLERLVPEIEARLAKWKGKI